jgi:hypothetical protein
MKTILIIVAVIVAVIALVFSGGRLFQSQGGSIHFPGGEFNVNDPQSQAEQNQRMLKDLHERDLKLNPLTGPGSDPCNSHPCDSQGRVTGPPFGGIG